MEALERYYQNYLFGLEWSNCEGYDLDAQCTKDRVERILEDGYISEENLDFVKSLLPEIESLQIKKDLEDYIATLFPESSADLI